MTFSFLIVTRNRPNDLEVTLKRLHDIMNLDTDEVMVFIDGCNATKALISKYTWVQWHSSDKQLGASPARHQLYPLATKDILIGLDDDAHPLETNFLDQVNTRFRESEHIGIIAFQEITGIFENDSKALSQAKKGVEFKTNEFVGCGFAMRRSVYEQIVGFPTWMDIYGEESAVAIQVLDKNYDIVYSYDIKVNHRKDSQGRRASGANYFRFEKQLVNTLGFYLIYYPKPTRKILKTIWHNGKKYAFKNPTYFSKYCKAILTLLIQLPNYLQRRDPVDPSTIQKRNALQNLTY
ncbi:glycosyltransferase family 2 protein [Nonlabens xiamenensis]|uniref:glycosyltransferase family 2 protein n=1 Tax=Nonlabens xiamenensis TaxID=2341043 RepID=UPI000F608AC8|nr:glycosyltransferase [Nonlabens xiamenensis]